VEHGVEHGPVGAALGARGSVAVKAVLADIEEKGGQVVIGEVGERPRVAVELIISGSLAQFDIEGRQAVQHPAFQLRHIRRLDPLLVRKALKRAEQITEGVAQLAIGIGGAGQHFLADPDILEIVGGGDPQAQDVGAIVADDGERIDDVADRLGHLAALAVEREAVGQHLGVRRAAAGGAAFEQRGLEPAAMLVEPST
jgi:hypothetical protein